MKQSSPYQSLIDPFYIRGEFYNHSTGDLDAEYKVQQLKLLLNLNLEKINSNCERFADIGCGTGKTTLLLHEMFSNLYREPINIDGYDIHPYVSQLREEKGVSFFSGDFCTLPHENGYDLAIMFDVIEHIPDPISFIREASKSTRILAFHMPLDDSLFSWVRNLQKGKLSNPGHLVILDVSSALNLLTFSGLRIIDFEYSPVFKAPSGRATLSQKLLNPLRHILYWISPYLTQKIFAGVSITVLAWTPYGLTTQK